MAQAPETTQTLPGKIGSVEAARLPSRWWLTVSPLLALQICLWVSLLAAGLFSNAAYGRKVAVDFAVFVDGAHIIHDGGNPYDNHTLYSSVRSFLRKEGLAPPPHEQLVRLANPPLFYWALQPLTRYPFPMVALSWIAAMLLLSLLGFLATLRYLGWGRLVPPAVVFLLMPQTLIGAVYGNVAPLLFASIALALVLAHRHPGAAGALATVGWLKPQISFPVILLLVLFYVSGRRQFLIGAGGTSLLLLGLTLVTTGPYSLGEWKGGLLFFWNGAGVQPNFASLAGLYAGWAQGYTGLGLEVGLVGLAAALTARAWLRGDTAAARPLSVAWLWMVWFLATPYAHFPDEILLALPILVLLGRDGGQVTRALPATSLYLLLLSVALFPDTAFHVNFLSLPLLAIAAFFPLMARARAEAAA